MKPSPSAGSIVMPNHRIPRVLGILHILFAANLLVCGLGMGLSAALTPFFVKSMTDVQEKLKADAEAKKQAEINDLKAREQAATTEAEKAEIRQVRVQSNTPSNRVIVFASPEAQAMPFTEPRFRAFTWTELLSGLTLNVLMMAAGIALVARWRWGPRLGIATAAAKILRLVVLYGIFAVAIVPDFARNQAQATMKQFTQMQGPGAPPPTGVSVEMFTKMNIIMYTVMAAGMVVFGSIYPAVSIWLLTRPGVREACSGTTGTAEPGEPW